VSATNQDSLPAAVLAGEIFRNTRLALEAGFTTVRECGGLDGGIRTAIEAGLVVGPRVFPSGPLLCQSGGHGDLRMPFHPHPPTPGIPGLSHMSAVCDGPDAIRLAAREAFRSGATQLKICISGGVISRTDGVEDLQFTLAELRAAVEEARNRGTYVTGHAMNNEAVRFGLQAGLECFEHVPVLDSDTAAQLRDAGAAFVSTLSVARLMATDWRQWGVPEEAVPRLADLAASGQKALRMAYDMGLLVGSGSDLLGPSQNRRGLEISLMAETLGAMAAITTATRSNALILRKGDQLGTVEPGKVADLIAVDGDPLSDPALFDDPARVRLVIQGGKVVKRT